MAETIPYLHSSKNDWQLSEAIQVTEKNADAVQNLNFDRIQFPCLVLLLKDCVIQKPEC